MHRLLADHRDDLIALCKKYHVRKLELFGSAATGEFVPGESDLDFLVEFDPAEDMNAFHQFFGLQLALAELFGCEVDLVDSTAMRNSYFIQSVNESRRSLWGESA